MATVESLTKTVPYGLDDEYYGGTDGAMDSFNALLAQLKAS